MPAYVVKGELAFENEFIETLTQNGWTYNSELLNATPKMLENHFREILNQNNRDSLKCTEITDSEMADVMRFIGGMSPLEANEFLTNGYRSEISLVRENPEQGKISLKAFWRDDVAGGQMHYEVIKQAIRPGKEDETDSPNRRFDVTLLFNGMPLIQVEEKRVDVTLKAATNQIAKYKSENKYDGLYSMVQLFVALKEDGAKYFANQKSADRFNDKFFFEWLDRGNKAVKNWKQFTTEFLKIPMAHNIISNYTIVNGESLVVLRPYQIHAVVAVREAFAEHKDGYIWHATGSGKTMTAFKVATLLQRNPHNQVVFLSDRKELDNQSGKNFTEFAAGSDDKIFETYRTDDLVKRLKSNDTGVIITTINKMKIAVERHNHEIEAGKKGLLEKVMKRRMVFIVDEAHRSQFGEMQLIIRKAFPSQSWYGFTGTPIFEFNKTAQDQTTESQFGPELHRYDIGNALKDGAILPFNTEYVQMMSASMNGEDLEESQVDDSMYEGDSKAANQYREKVVKWINKNWRKKSVNGQFNALLAVSNIQQAIKFYDLFMEFNKKTDKPLKIGLTYSLNENGDDNQNQRDGLVQAMKDYSMQYMQSESTFTLDNDAAYIDDIAKRTARMEGPYKSLKPEENIDLTIVVARLLTGFDAQRLNSLYMDKMMQYQGLIQAYARTNRVYDKNKSQGNIVVFRRPVMMEERTKDAFEKYAGEGTFKQVFRPDFKDMQEEFKAEVAAVLSYVPTSQDANELTQESTKDKIEFLDRFRSLAKKLQYISSYSEFDWSEQAKEYGISEEEFGFYQGAFQNVKDSIVAEPGDEFVPAEIDFDFDDVVINALLIDREYVLTLAAKYLRAKQDVESDASSKARERVVIANNEYNEALEKLRKSGAEDKAVQVEEYVRETDGKILPDDFDANQDFLSVQYDKKIGAMQSYANEYGADYKYVNRMNTEYEATGDISHESELRNSANMDVALKNGHKYHNVLSFKSALSRSAKDLVVNQLKKYRP
jgi:type I restriction enzyme R subunit